MPSPPGVATVPPLMIRSNVDDMRSAPEFRRSMHLHVQNAKLGPRNRKGDLAGRPPHHPRLCWRLFVRKRSRAEMPRISARRDQVSSSSLYMSPIRGPSPEVKTLELKADTTLATRV